MLIFIFYGLIELFVVAQSGIPYALQIIQKINIQKCMQCPELYVNQICGIIDAEHAAGFAVAEKKPVPCGSHSIYYDTYWSNKICMKALISCSTNKYQYVYTYAEVYSDTIDASTSGMGIKESIDKGKKKIPKFFDSYRNSTFGLFLCNENGQWEHAHIEDYWHPSSKRVQVPQNISCLFSNLVIMNRDTSLPLLP
uniref:Uncharacterized protein n=1 Tax=Panagrolaimus superbus TaxID=310955 RepID=A0A914XRW7_9BILA